MVQIADWIDRAISLRHSREELGRIRLAVRELCEHFPLYPDLKRSVE